MARQYWIGIVTDAAITAAQGILAVTNCHWCSWLRWRDSCCLRPFLYHKSCLLSLPYYLEAPVSTYEQSGETTPILLAQFHPEQQKEKQELRRHFSLNYYQHVIFISTGNEYIMGRMYAYFSRSVISKKYWTILRKLVLGELVYVKSCKMNVTLVHTAQYNPCFIWLITKLLKKDGNAKVEGVHRNTESGT